MKAVILAGGLGSRISEETDLKPKPMIEIGGRPILWHIMKHYRHFDVRNFILCLGYKGDVIRDYFLNYPLYNSDFAIDFQTGDVETLGNSSGEDWRIVLADTGAQSLTGTRIKRALNYAPGNMFMATYGDGVSDVDLERLIAHHRASGKLATVTAVRPSSRFGELAIENNVVTRFREKPQVADGWINGGYFVFDKRAFDRVRPTDDVTLEEAVLETLANQGELSVYKHHGFWQSMDTYREMTLLNDMWSGDHAPWNIWKECRLTA